jgi:prolipoprotein diacylglyceryltransferase
MSNPYAPPKKHKQSRTPKHIEPLVDWYGLTIVLGLPIGILTMVIIILATSAVLNYFIPQ